MAYSCNPGHKGHDPFDLLPGANGPQGAFHPNAALQLLGDTPGPLGVMDCADPDVGRLALLKRELHFTLVQEGTDGWWDYDPKGLLNGDHLSPDFVAAAHRALRAATAAGLRPQVAEAYRTPARSAGLAKAAAHQAAGAWGSCHNYGLAMDVYPHDAQGKRIDNGYVGTFKGWTHNWWYKQAKALAKDFDQFVWGANFGTGDSDHFEYHPNWKGGAGAVFLGKVKLWAQKAALDDGGSESDAKKPDAKKAEAKEPPYDDWIEYFWWAAGAGGTSPASAFLTKNPVP